MERKKIAFTPKDLFFESGLYLLQTKDLIGFWQIITSGYEYNTAKRLGDPEQVAAAYRELHHELKLFKKNFLNRNKGHW